jgi:periplasmic divalent cation tolerance protein
MVDALVVLSTFPSLERATAAADALVGERLAACVNLVPGLTSIYRWQGAIQRDAEVLAIIKTTRAGYAALAARLAALHPYEVPELLALDVTTGAAPYLAWLAAQVAPPAPPAG